jgi:hypothetical protein
LSILLRRKGRDKLSEEDSHGYAQAQVKEFDHH